MEIFIDLEDPNPLFAQLIQQIKDAILKGDLEPGAPLPSIRPRPAVHLPFRPGYPLYHLPVNWAWSPPLFRTSLSVTIHE